MSGYIISLAILNLIFIVFYFLIFKFSVKLRLNHVFILCIFTLYCITLLIQLLSQGSNSKAFIDTVPTSNISPFVFCTLPLCLFKRLRNFIFPMIVFLSVGIILSVEISHYRFINENLEYNIALSLDGLNHMLYALFGVYLVVSNQVQLSLKSFIYGCISILTIVATMILLNLIFHTSFFGLNLYGNHSIYDIVITTSSVLSSLIYVLGLIIFLFLGLLFQFLNLKLNKQLYS